MLTNILPVLVLSICGSSSSFFFFSCLFLGMLLKSSFCYRFLLFFLNAIPVFLHCLKISFVSLVLFDAIPVFLCHSSFVFWLVDVFSKVIPVFLHCWRCDFSSFSFHICVWIVPECIHQNTFNDDGHIVWHLCDVWRDWSLVLVAVDVLWVSFDPQNVIWMLSSMLLRFCHGFCGEMLSWWIV